MSFRLDVTLPIYCAEFILIKEVAEARTVHSPFSETLPSAVYQIIAPEFIHSPLEGTYYRFLRWYEDNKVFSEELKMVIILSQARRFSAEYIEVRPPEEVPPEEIPPPTPIPPWIPTPPPEEVVPPPEEVPAPPPEVPPTPPPIAISPELILVGLLLLALVLGER